MSLSENRYAEYRNLDDVYQELIALYDIAQEKGFDLGQELYTQSAFFVDYFLLLSEDIQLMIKDYLFCKTFNCPPYKSLADTPDELKNNFLIIDSEYGKVKSENQKKETMKDKK